MPSRSRGWRIQPKDVTRFRTAYVKAANVVEDAAEAMRSRALDDMAERILPRLPDVGDDYEAYMRGSMLTRRDYERNIRYLERIAKAARSEAPRDTRQVSYYGKLTAIAYDEASGTYEGAFLRAEREARETQRRRRVERELKSMGIATKRVPLMAPDPLTGEVKKVYDRNRHVVTVTIPATPENRQRYAEAIAKDPSLEIPEPKVVPEGAHIEQYGDVVKVRKSKRKPMSAEKLAESLNTDMARDLSNRGYFFNYGAIVGTTLPPEIADEIDTYIDRINELSPAKRDEVYRFIRDHEEDAGTIEYLYLDRSGTMGSKVKNMMTFWRTQVAPMIGVSKPKDAASLTTTNLQAMLEREGYKAGGAQDISDEYKARRKSGDAESFTLEDIRKMIYGV